MQIKSTLSVVSNMYLICGCLVLFPLLPLTPNPFSYFTPVVVDLIPDLWDQIIGDAYMTEDVALCFWEQWKVKTPNFFRCIRRFLSICILGRHVSSVLTRVNEEETRWVCWIAVFFKHALRMPAVVWFTFSLTTVSPPEWKLQFSWEAASYKSWVIAASSLPVPAENASPVLGKYAIKSASGLE